ncbi:MAG: GDP-mannose 4,6-dehydratase [Proteobacteria bacterium]|nr:GDP-mannose 4,6-dehydratase [Pseudomonadota bacterium]
MKTAFITGITGQDGAYLAKLLLEKGYAVHGGVRRTASMNRSRLAELGIENEISYHDFDLLELSNIASVIDEIKPDEIYNLAAQSFVAASFRQPLLTSELDALGVLRILEALRMTGSQARFYQASTSEMFGKIQNQVQSEMTPLYPRSPYGVAKLFAHWITVNYREAHNIFAASGILFNHESPLRGQEFVTRKITLTLAKIKHRNANILELGNLNAARDWGFAGDFVQGMWKMLQHKVPDTYVLATGRTNSVRDFVTHAADALGFKLAWEGDGVNETARDRRTNKIVVRVNPAFFRASEVDTLIGCPTKAERDLDWKPKATFEELVERMASADNDRVALGRVLF